MSPIIAKPLEFLKNIFFLVFPMFDSAQKARGGDSAVRWLARALLVGAFLAILAVLNHWEKLGLPNVIQPTAPWFARRFWLPLLVICLYAMLWLGWWLYRLFNWDIEPVGSEFPDIDRAWDQAVDALGRADIVLDTAPLFLVLGWPSASEDDFFRAAGIKGPVRQVPGDPTAPLHVTANRDGVWLTCAGACLLGQYHDDNPRSVALEEVMATMSEDSADPYKTMGMGAAGAATLRIEDFQAVKNVVGLAKIGRKKRVDDPDFHLARLRHLCRLIIRDRRGFCPINGVLLTVPIGVDTRSDLAEVADACRNDLTTAFDTFQMRCPVLALVSGLEQVSGFSELIARLPSEQVRKRMGQRFPLVPDLTAGEVPEKVQDAIEVVSGNLFPSMIHTMFQIESKGLDDVDEVLRSNCQLFRFSQAIVERGERMARLMKDCIPSLRGEPVMFGGCYFAGTGHDAATQQAFASGVLMRMIKEDQDSVTWTEEAIDSDATAARMAGRLRIALILIITLGVLAAAGLLIKYFIGK
jgi:hypothetical protein